MGHAEDVSVKKPAGVWLPQPEGLKFLWEAPRLLRQSLTCEASTTTILAKHYAENYFQLGWRIIPLKGKLPFIEGWQKARLSSEEFFAKWREGDNVGVVCGWLNDKFALVALDVDEPSLIGFNPKPWLDKGAMAHTTSNALRIVFYTDSHEVANFSRKVTVSPDDLTEEQKTLLIKGKGKQSVTILEVLAEGRQFMAPPSRHPETGAVLEWVAPPKPPNEALVIHSLEELKTLIAQSVKAQWIIEELFESAKKIAADETVLRSWLEKIKPKLDIAGEGPNYLYCHCPFHKPDENPSFAIHKHKFYAIDYHTGEVFNLKQLAEALNIKLEGASLSPLEILKLELSDAETITIHPLIDYHPKIGLTIGAPLTRASTHFPGSPNSFVVFLAEKPILFNKKPGQNVDTFYTCVSLRKVKWLAISQNCKYKTLLHSARALETGQIDFPPKNEVFEKTLEAIYKYWGHSDKRYYILVACWAIGTWFHPIFNYYPILNPQGQRRTGKTTLLEVLRQICWNTTQREVALREAGLFRTIQDSRPTYIIDITKLDSQNKNYIDIVDVCEAGTERNGIVKRVNKDTGEPVVYEVYGPKAIATRTELPFVEKCIRIITEADPSKTKNRHKLERDPVWPEIVDLLVRAAVKYWPEIVQAYEELEPTDKLQGRFFDYWSPLLAVCKVFAPERFEELLGLAEEYAATQTFEDIITEVENAILSLLMEYNDETLTITLKDLTLKVKELVPWLSGWHYVKSALENLHIVSRKYSSSKGLTYQLNLIVAHQKAKERLNLSNNNQAEAQQPASSKNGRSFGDLLSEFRQAHSDCFNNVEFYHWFVNEHGLMPSEAEALLKQLVERGEVFCSYEGVWRWA